MVFSGGGTGGHLYPALALADALAAERRDVRPRFVGAQRGLEARVLPERGHEPLLLDVEGLARSRPLHNVTVLRKLVAAVRATAARYRAWRPDLVVVTGGYAAAPAGLAAVALRVPLAVQEQNSVPGVTTRLLARWARQVHVAFPEAIGRLPAPARGRARVSGNPIRTFPDVQATEARTRLGLPEQGVLVLVAGGSQGSRALNARVLEAVTAVTEGRLARPHGMQVLWSTGPAHIADVEQQLDALGAPVWVHARAYLDDMPLALRAADVAVSRAGAMATSEYLAVGLPAVLVPLPTAAADHQTHNAAALDAAGAAVCLREADTSGMDLWECLLSLLADRGRRDGMAVRARERSRPAAAQEIARDLATLLPPETSRAA
ncbi:MAG: undecaprenyldiphospho-muramoylpentapeptide beta-N-acetylglucosaminyltransferase [Gemmatimonadota bacterium]